MKLSLLGRRALFTLAIVVGVGHGRDRSTWAQAVVAERPAPIQGPRELLSLYGVDAELLKQLANDSIVDPANDERLLKVLQAVRRFKPADVDRWTHGIEDWPDIVANSAAMQGELAPLSGRLKRVSEIKPSASLAARFDLPRFYRCELANADGKTSAVIYSLRASSHWPTDKPLDERAGAKAVLVRLTDEPDGQRQGIFVAGRVADYPATTLGQLGMDRGLLDDVRPIGPLTADDRECFYQLLAAAGRAAPRELTKQTTGPAASLVPLLESPRKHVGELLAIEGTALRAMLVRVDDSDVVDRLGIDHYWELEVTVNLERPVKLSGGERAWSFPAVFCLRELPDGFPRGERIHESVRVPAFYLKNWAYRPQQPSQSPDPERQLAPLFIGRDAQWRKTEAAASDTSGVGVVAGILAAAIGTCALVWFIVRGGGRSHRREVPEKFVPPATNASTPLHDSQDGAHSC